MPLRLPVEATLAHLPAALNRLSAPLRKTNSNKAYRPSIVS